MPTKILFIILGITLLMANPTHALEKVTGGELIKKCGSLKNSRDVGWCLGFMQGWHTRDIRTPEECVPYEVSSRKLLKVVIQFIKKSEPGFKTLDVGILIQMAANEKWGC